jgi:hypothetical protein
MIVTYARQNMFIIQATGVILLNVVEAFLKSEAKFLIRQVTSENKLAETKVIFQSNESLSPS